jgi:uncharacterized protein (DUF362 family)
MSAIYEEFERDLERFRVRYAHAPRQELTRLFLLALEREEIVSVAYREAAIAERLARMPIEEEARTLIRHALLWAWKDEEMHAIYIRGAILRTGGPLLRGTAYARQMAGAVGGWAASVSQHARWRDAPLSRFAANAVVWGGMVAGQVPSAVRRALAYGPFRSFCAYNVDAEKTAARCWQRIVELASKDPAFTPAILRDFVRIAADEERHERIFEILERALGDDDRLVPGEDASTLAAKFAAVGEAFLPRARRGRASIHPLGRGGEVVVLEGTSADEKLAAFRRLLATLDLEATLQRVARAGGKEIGQLKVAIKPTFMLGYDRRDRAIITDAELVDELARFCRDAGCLDVAVIEGPHIYDHFYRHRSVAEVAAYFGFTSPHYRLVDASAEQVPHDYSRGMAQYTVARSWKEADFRISFAKLRSHPVELAYLTVANVEWIGGRCDEFIFCERQAQRETAVMMLLDDFPPDLALIDGYDLAADGLMGVMGAPHPRTPHRLYGGYDALAVDIVAARHMGVRESRQSSILRTAVHWFGEPFAPVVHGPDTPIGGLRGPYHNELSAMLSFMAYPVYVVGSGRGALFVPQMDQEAFPSLIPETRLLRIGRSAMRRLIGLQQHWVSPPRPSAP